jgi:hypothetical protein
MKLKQLKILAIKPSPCLCCFKWEVDKISCVHIMNDLNMCLIMKRCFMQHDLTLLNRKDFGRRLVAFFTRSQRNCQDSENFKNKKVEICIHL